MYRSLRPATYLIYLDPPYHETVGYGVDFAFSEYEKMAQRLKAIKGRVIVSLNDHPAIRQVFADYHMETIDIQYMVSGVFKAMPRKELIVFSWDDAAQPVGLF